jgi:chromosome partitioning protein
LKIGGVFITQYDGRKVLNRDVVKRSTLFLKAEVLKTKIRDNIAVSGSTSTRMDIFRYNAKET